ncbi:hypothetical protein [Streptomyces sp. NPDC002676]
MEALTQHDGTPAAVLTTSTGVFAVVTTDIDLRGDRPRISVLGVSLIRVVHRPKRNLVIREIVRA